MVTTQSLRFGLALVVLGLAASLVGCGGRVVRADGGGGSEDTTTTTTTATTTATATGGAGGAGGGSTTTSSTTTPDSGLCAPFADEPGSGKVILRFHNSTAAPVYLPATCGNARYMIERLDGGDPSVTYGYDSSCLQTCEDLWTSPGFVCDACAPTVVRVEAGATRDMVWSGTGLTYTTAMPPHCYASPGIDGCSRVLTAPAGNYLVEVECSTGCVGDCACDDDGVCFNSSGGGETYLNSTALTYPGQSLVELIFQPGTP